MHDRRSFGLLVKERRQCLQLTQRQLATLVGCAPDSVRKLEAGRYRPSRAVAERLASRLQIEAPKLDTFLYLARRTAVQPAMPFSAMSLHGAIPASTSGLIGRATELAQLMTLIRTPDMRWVTLFGPGGAGKTRLVQAAATQMQSTVGRDVVWVSCAAINDADLLLPHLAHVLELREIEGHALAHTLLTQLRDRRLVLVLDNLEQIHTGVGPAVELLAACPGITVLATSRRVLPVPGAHEMQLAPLRLPGRGDKDDPMLLAAVPAVALFLERVQAVRPSFVLSADTMTDVAAICVRLDGLPLALELAAARMKFVAPARLLRHLEAAPGTLGTGMRDLPRRQQSLESTLDWSYALLSPAAAQLFGQLSVFADSWTLTAMQFICPPGAKADGQFALSLLELEEQTLVVHAYHSSELRFSMLRTIRDYAAQCVSPLERAVLALRHAQFYAERVRQTAALSAPDQQSALQDLSCDYAELSAALHWCLAGGDPALGVEIAGGLGAFWDLTGRISEGRLWLEQALLQPTAPARRSALLAAGRLAFVQAAYAHSATYYTEGLALAKVAGDRWCQLLAVNGLGGIAQRQGLLAEACQWYEAGLALLHPADSPHVRSGLLNNLALVKSRQDEDVSAQALFLESLAIKRDLGDVRGSAIILNNLGVEALRAHHWTDAETFFYQSLEISRAIGDQEGIAYALNNLGVVATQFGQLDKAWNFHEHGLEVGRALGDQWSILLSHLGRAEIAVVRDTPTALAQEAGMAWLLCQKINSAEGIGHLLGALARWLCAQPAPVQLMLALRCWAAQRAAYAAADFCLSRRDLAEIATLRTGVVATLGLKQTEQVERQAAEIPAIINEVLIALMLVEIG